MCDERERLIGYVYDDCDAEEKDRVENHLAGCETCRQEISGLRSVRTDLLAWNVPDHGSVWTPFVQTRLPWWREVPVWAMAAAASVMFVLGAAGGVATQALKATPVSGPSRAGLTPVALTNGDLSSLETRVLRTMRAEMDARTQLVSGHATTAGAVDNDKIRSMLADLVLTSETRQFSQMKDLHSEIYMSRTRTENEISGLTRQIASLQEQLDSLTHPGGR